MQLGWTTSPCALAALSLYSQGLVVNNAHPVDVRLTGYAVDVIGR